MIQAVFTVGSAATGLRICLTHTLCLKNVLDCASCHKPHYVSVKCEVSREIGPVPRWCSVCACVSVCLCVCVCGCGCRCWKYLVWIVLLRIWTRSAINYYPLMQWLCVEECWEALLEWVTAFMDPLHEYRGPLIETKVGMLVSAVCSIFWGIFQYLKHCKVLAFQLFWEQQLCFINFFPTCDTDCRIHFVDHEEMLTYFKIIYFKSIYWIYIRAWLILDFWGRCWYWGAKKFWYISRYSLFIYISGFQSGRLGS